MNLIINILISFYIIGIILLLYNKEDHKIEFVDIIILIFWPLLIFLLLITYLFDKDIFIKIYNEVNKKN